MTNKNTNKNAAREEGQTYLSYAGGVYGPMPQGVADSVLFALRSQSSRVLAMDTNTREAREKAQPLAALERVLANNGINIPLK